MTHYIHKIVVVIFDQAEIVNVIVHLFSITEFYLFGSNKNTTCCVSLNLMWTDKLEHWTVNIREHTIKINTRYIDFRTKLCFHIIPTSNNNDKKKIDCNHSNKHYNTLFVYIYWNEKIYWSMEFVRKKYLKFSHFQIMNFKAFIYVKQWFFLH